jgi:hypothetical protein
VTVATRTTVRGDGGTRIAVAARRDVCTRAARLWAVARGLTATGAWAAGAGVAVAGVAGAVDDGAGVTAAVVAWVSAGAEGFVEAAGVVAVGATGARFAGFAEVGAGVDGAGLVAVGAVAVGAVGVAAATVALTPATTVAVVLSTAVTVVDTVRPTAPVTAATGPWGVDAAGGGVVGSTVDTIGAVGGATVVTTVPAAFVTPPRIPSAWAVPADSASDSASTTPPVRIRVIGMRGSFHASRRVIVGDLTRPRRRPAR